MAKHNWFCSVLLSYGLKITSTRFPYMLKFQNNSEKQINNPKISKESTDPKLYSLFHLSHSTELSFCFVYMVTVSLAWVIATYIHQGAEGMFLG